MDMLNASGISSLVNTFKYSEQTKLLTPVQTRKDKYSSQNAAWGTLNSKIDSLKTALSSLKIASNSSIFYSKKAVLSKPDYFTVTTNQYAAAGSYDIKVKQLAKNDLAVSQSLTSATSVTNMAGKHSFSVTSGDYTSNVEVSLTDAETNQTIMQKITSAINSSTATVKSNEMNSSDLFTGSGSFKINLNGNESTINYDISGKTYSEALDEIVSKVKSVSGLEAEKITDGSNVSLQIKSADSSKYLTIAQSSDTGGLLSALGINAEKVKGAAGLINASVFTPSTGATKMTFSADLSGYDNRINMSDTSGSLLNFIGLSSEVLTNRTLAADDNAAGFKYSAASSLDNQLNAKMEFNGVNVQRNTNMFSDLVTGLSFTLKAVTPETENYINLSIDNDSDKIKEEVNNFIKKFNDAYTYIKANQTSGTQGRGIFTGDAMANSIVSLLRNGVTGNVTGLPAGNLSRLSDVGITFDPETGLTLSDSTKFSNAISQKNDQLASLFTSEKGIAVQLFDKVQSLVGTTGAITKIRSSYDNNIKYLNDKISSINMRIDKSAEVYRKKYEVLQQQMSALYTAYGFFG